MARRAEVTRGRRPGGRRGGRPGAGGSVPCRRRWSAAGRRRAGRRRASKSPAWASRSARSRMASMSPASARRSRSPRSRPAARWASSTRFRAVAAALWAGASASAPGTARLLRRAGRPLRTWRPRRRRCRPGRAQLPQPLPHGRLGQGAGELGHLPPVLEGPHGRDALDPEGLARPGLASTSTLASTHDPLASSASFSRTGPSDRHGAHHSAQKSTTTGTSRERSITSWEKVCSLTSMMFGESFVVCISPFPNTEAGPHLPLPAPGVCRTGRGGCSVLPLGQVDGGRGTAVRRGPRTGRRRGPRGRRGRRSGRPGRGPGRGRTRRTSPAPRRGCGGPSS